ncbi:hypothetical protein ACFVYR_24175 [Streptomyces sp. NPDC058284]|uniref:hypothetical protein n=1 Tax=unclassified Streptomyces TaxID=2593676 RepID=UPI003658E562
MSAPAPSRRTGGLVVAVVLVIVGAVVVSIAVAVFGGSPRPGPEPLRRPTAQPVEHTRGPTSEHASGPTGEPTSGPAASPTPEASCLLYDFECQAGDGSGGVTLQPSTPPVGTGATGGNGGLLGGTG